jgi:hypothetical protein
VYVSPSPSLDNAHLKNEHERKATLPFEPHINWSDLEVNRTQIRQKKEDKKVLQMERGETQRGALSDKTASRLRLFLRLTTSQFGSNRVDKKATEVPQ